MILIMKNEVFVVQFLSPYPLEMYMFTVQSELSFLHISENFRHLKELILHFQFHLWDMIS